jgi:hypothetical protein
MESSEWENLFCRKVSFLTDLHCQFRGEGQGDLAVSVISFFQAQWDRWDRCDLQNHQT